MYVCMYVCVYVCVYVCTYVPYICMRILLSHHMTITCINYIVANWGIPLAAISDMKNRGPEIISPKMTGGKTDIIMKI